MAAPTPQFVIRIGDKQIAGGGFAIPCVSCGVINWWSTDSSGCYWCGEKLCVLCVKHAQTAHADVAGMPEPHFCMSCGRQRTDCKFTRGGRMCVLCGKEKARRCLPSIPPHTAAAHRADEEPEALVEATERIPDEVLLHIFTFFSGLRDAVAALLVCKRWNRLGSCSVVWEALARKRWPSISVRQTALLEKGWHNYYIRRHFFFTLDEPPIPIEDCGRACCPASYNELLPASSRGRTLPSRRCHDCLRTVFKCTRRADVELAVENAWVAEIGTSDNDPWTPAAFPGCDPQATQDWGFHDWYVGLITRADAADRLRDYETGTFLVRESLTRPNEYCITVMVRGAAEHIRISKDSDGFHFGLPGFPSIPALVEHYRTVSLGTHFFRAPTVLRGWPKRLNPAEELARITDPSLGASKDTKPYLRADRRVMSFGVTVQQGAGASQGAAAASAPRPHHLQPVLRPGMSPRSSPPEWMKRASGGGDGAVRGERRHVSVEVTPASLPVFVPPDSSAGTAGQGSASQM